MDKRLKNTIIAFFSEIKDLGYKVVIWCSGSDPQNLELAPNAERIRHGQFGSLVLIPATVALFTMGYAISTLTSSYIIIIPVAITWSLIVLTLDRFIVSTLKLYHEWWKRLGAFLVRLLFATLIGFIVGHPVVLRAVHDEINYELQRERLDSNKHSQRNIIQIEDHYDTLNKVIENSIETLEKEYKKGEISYFREIHGDTTKDTLDDSYKSKDKGNGLVAQNKKKDLDKLDKKIDNQIKENKKKIDVNNVVKKGLIDTIRNGSVRLDSLYWKGYLRKMSALEHIKNQDSQAVWLFWMIIAIFIILDSSAVFYKYILPDKLYEKLCRLDSKTLDGDIPIGSPPGIYKYRKLRELSKINTDTDFDIEKKKHETIEAYLSQRYDNLYTNIDTKEFNETIIEIESVRNLYRKFYSYEKNFEQKQQDNDNPTIRMTSKISKIIAHTISFVISLILVKMFYDFSGYMLTISLLAFNTFAFIYIDDVISYIDIKLNTTNTIKP